VSMRWHGRLPSRPSARVMALLGVALALYTAWHPLSGMVSVKEGHRAEAVH